MPDAGGRARYSAVLRSPDVARLVLSMFAARSPIGVAGLAMVLLVRETTGSYATAGAVAAGYTIGIGVSAPFLGRAIDRRGARAVLPLVAAINAAGLAALFPLAQLGAAPAVLVAVSFAAGLALPPIGSVLRRMWPELVAPELLTAAYALDSVLVEVAFVLGPLLVAAIATFSSPGYALLVASASVLAGTLAFVSCPPVGRHAVAATGPRAHGRLGALRAPGVRTVVVAFLPIGWCIGACEVAFPAFGEAIGDKALAGPLIALWSLGSGAAGLAYGAFGHRFAPARAYIAGAALLPIVTLPLALPSSFVAMVPLALLAGATIAPMLTSSNHLINDVAPRDALTEAFTWTTTALLAGVSLGTAVSGSIVESHGWRESFLAAAVVGAAGVVIVWLRRATFEPAVDAAPVAQ